MIIPRIALSLALLIFISQNFSEYKELIVNVCMCIVGFYAVLRITSEVIPDIINLFRSQ